MITTILFDLDGTLYSENQFAESGFKAVAGYISKKYKLNSSKVFSILKKDFKAGLRNKNFDALLKKLDIKKEKVQNLVAIYRNHYPSSIRLYPDARNALKVFKNFEMGLITNGCKISQKNKILALKINSNFKGIFIQTKFGDNDWRASTGSFKALLKKTKSKPEESIYVGDNPLRDFMGAKKMGIATVRIKRKGSDYYNISAVKCNLADWNVKNLLSLKKIVDKINKK
jgi:putative hydrolase of the HAD superfamily